MKTSLRVMLAFLLTSLGVSAQNPYFAGLESLSTPPVFGCSPFQDSLWGYDMASGTLVYRSAPSLAGFTVTGMTSITTHPCTEQIFAIAKLSGVTGRVLCTFDPQTDQLTQIGNMGDNFSSISFTSDGTLYGTTGDGAMVSEAFYQINTTTGAATLVGALGNGADGEVVCYDYDNDRYFHFSGNGTVVFESFQTPVAVPSTITPTGISGSLGSGETFGALYWGNDSILISTISSNFRFMTSAGVVGPILFSTPDDLRGLAKGNRWLTMSGADTFCENENLATLTASGGQAYQWTMDGNAIAGATNATYIPTQSGWYNCIVTRDTINCTATPADTAWFGKLITVNPLPAVSVTPNNAQYICAGNPSVTFIGTPSGATYQWYGDGAILAGETNDTYTATAAGNYNLYVTDANGCSDSLATAISVMDAPASVQTPVGTDTICAPNTVTLTVTPGADSYQWLNNGSPIAGATNDTYVAAITGVYSCEVTYGACTEVTATYDLLVDPCIGLDELHADFANLYPNPANDKVVLSTNTASTYAVQVYANDGQLVQAFTFTGTEYTLDIAQLSKGSYLMTITSEIGTSRKQLIKQ